MGIYSSIANSALINMLNKIYYLSPVEIITGLVCVWKPVILLGLPAYPTASTA
jgi:thiosulfate reductase cytochrome b subunit